MFTRRSIILPAAAAVLAVACGAVLWWDQRPEPFATSPKNTQSPIPDPQSLPNHPVVRQIIRDGPDMPYLKFNYVIKELPTDLAPHDIDALLAFIMGPRPAAFQDGEWGSLTNDIQEALSVQVVPSEKVCDALIATYRDESRIQLMRDYALQHVGGFALYLVHTSGTRNGTLPPFFGRLVGELKSAAADHSKPWCGTSFNLLDGLLRAAEYTSVELDGVSSDALLALAVPAASNPAAPLNARLPALQLASRRHAPQAPEMARGILADPKANLMLVQSAAAVLGEQGSPDDVPLLEGLLAANRPHTQTALRSALQRLQKP